MRITYSGCTIQISITSRGKKAEKWLHPDLLAKIITLVDKLIFKCGFEEQVTGGKLLFNRAPFHVVELALHRPWM